MRCATQPVGNCSQSGVDWTVAGSTGEDLQQLGDTVTLFYCNVGARQCGSVAH